MQKQFRKNTLCAVDKILKKTMEVQIGLKVKGMDYKMQGIINQLDTLRDNISLLLTNNHFLETQLHKKDEQIESLEKHVIQQQYELNSYNKSLKKKYSRAVQELNFMKFTQKKSPKLLLDSYQTNGRLTPQLPRQSQFLQQSIITPFKEQVTAPQQQQQQKHHPILSPDSSFILQSKLFTPIQLSRQESSQLFPRAITIRQNKEPKTILDSPRTKTQAKRERQRQKEKEKNKQRSIIKQTKVSKQPEQSPIKKKKSEELARLVAKQGIMHPICDRYLETDLI